MNISVLIVDKGIESCGILANASLVLGLSAGRVLPNETFGQDVVDGEGNAHLSLTNIGHYVRKAGQNKLRTLREKFAQEEDVTLIDYTEQAAPADYQEYQDSLASASGEEIKYRALYVYGPEETVVPLTKNLSRL